MKRRTVVVLLLVASLFVAPHAARASAEGVGLGVSIGAVMPKGGALSFDDVGLNWGFWVDIPIAWKFHISPSAEIYNLGGDVDENPATDIVLNFKFILPVSFVRIFAGVAAGLTVHNEYDANVGLLAGVSFRVFGPLELFVSAKYKILIDDPNVHMIHTNAGFLFVF